MPPVPGAQGLYNGAMSQRRKVFPDASAGVRTVMVGKHSPDDPVVRPDNPRKRTTYFSQLDRRTSPPNMFQRSFGVGSTPVAVPSVIPSPFSH